jgi:predicted metal-dependent enzyme (double-stranded beta helix superfamily)
MTSVPEPRSLGGVSITVDDVVTRCRSAIGEHTPQLAVRDVIDELVRDPSALATAVGPVSEGGIRPLHRSDDLTVLHIAWTPGMQLNPHEHRMWAVVGLYGGQEDNTFFRRVGSGIETSGGRSLESGQVLLMGDDTIHAVANPRREYAVALHVYGGDFFVGQRSEWDEETFAERPRDVEGTMRRFAAANAAWAAAQVERGQRDT